ncbi:hypothetical protein NDU88_002954 [Pleurodeles waltl]|uniref:Uncharacterized protein n=1 Tax=Pleurodeles waltl TaxID=8319 RepID=A0AAV7V0N8_PLEWA|nr:hypothetical protein NDU88_002954 [Pleurodeles waltl]
MNNPWHPRSFMELRPNEWTEDTGSSRRVCQEKELDWLKREFNLEEPPLETKNRKETAVLGRDPEVRSARTPGIEINPDTTAEEVPEALDGQEGRLLDILSGHIR